MRIYHTVGPAATLLLLVIHGFLAGGSLLSAQTLPGDEELIPALLAIHALRASLGMDVPAERILVDTEGPVLKDRQAAEWLMKLGASRCSAAYQGDAVVIDCRGLDTHERERELRYFQLTNGWMGRLGRETLAQSNRHLIMVVGGGAPLVVDIADLDAAARTFDIDMDGFSISGGYPTDEERSSGIGWVLYFGGRRSR